MKRTEKGFRFYVESMKKSTDDKAEKILPLAEKGLQSVRGDILDLGAGCGELDASLLSLAEKFKVRLVLADADPRMIKILKERFSDCPQVSVVSEDAANLGISQKFSVVICSSLLHEIFSEKRDINELKKTLKNIRSHLLIGGTLVIRDGVKPSQSKQIILIKLLKPALRRKLRKFAASYKHLTTNPRTLKIKGEEYIAISQEMAYEFAVKYRYPEINWPVEMREQFGFWTESEARKMLEEAGFKIVHLEKYLLPYFEAVFQKDFVIFERKKLELIKLNYFDTHMVIAAKS